MSKTAHTRRRNRQRTLRKIHTLAVERQQAWLETGQPNLTQRLTSELRNTYESLRTDRATDPLPQTWSEVGSEGTGLERLPFLGHVRVAD